MRQLLAASAILASACASAPARGGAYSDTLTPLKPETIASCNAANLAVDLSGDGAILVNNQPATMESLEAAAKAKDAACQNAPAMVLYSYAATAPAEKRDAIKLLLKQTIVHLTLTEASKG